MRHGSAWRSRSTRRCQVNASAAFWTEWRTSAANTQRAWSSNGPECTSRALDQWAYEHGVELAFIRPGKPIENCFVESFNGRFRDECLNVHWFVGLEDARLRIEDWRLDYNLVRPHSALRDLAPSVFARETGLRSTASTSAPPPARPEQIGASLNS